MQLFSWFEATMRYTQLHDILHSNSPDFSGDTKYTDKSVDAKIRLIEESYWLPDVSIGIRDFGGTGLFDGEYLVANKQFGSFDVALGIGWGYLGNRANLSGSKQISDDCGRDTSYRGSGGKIDFGRMFMGCTSLFGGVEYQTPYQPLRLKLEYDGNDYQSDRPAVHAGIDMTPKTPWNVGAVYSVSDWADLRISYERGTTLTAGISLATNLATLKPSWVDEPRPNYQPTSKKSELSDDKWQKLVNDVADIAGYSDVEIYQGTSSVTVRGEPTKYRDLDETHYRTALLLANSGLDVSHYHIVDTNNHQGMQETAVDALAFQRVADYDYPGAVFDDAKSSSGSTYVEGMKKGEQKEAFSFGLSPVLQQSFGGAENFYLYALGVSASGSYDFNNNWQTSGAIYANFIDNYDKFNFTVPPDGTDLKRVRTLSRQYYDQFLRLDNLQLTHFNHHASSVYSQAYGGYLEAMFAGAGTEWLYRPYGKKWAIGTDVNYVVQRDPDSAFGLFSEEQHYDDQTGRYYRVQTGTVTGHATLYWQPQFWSLFDDTLFKVSAGRYLSEDIGMTVDFSKQFDSGVIAGAFATKTDLSAEEFGEGSFSKGFYISVPLDLMTARPSRERATISWLPLQRDGGQMLVRQYHLFDMTDIRSPWALRPSR